MKEELNVLVVDDDKGICNLFIQTLKKNNIITLVLHKVDIRGKGRK